MIRLRDISVDLGKFSLRDIDFSVSAGEYFVILGPTGAGKSMILKVIAGLCPIRKGEVYINGINATGMPPEARNIGYVPQDYALFPFLNVYANIRFGLKQKNNAQVEEKINVISDLIGIAHLLERNVGTLSGGEKQRVALARALAISPGILLLDEPLSSLDLSTARRLRCELRRFHEELGITTIHVTHNLIEAEELADQIAVVNEGRLEQIGSKEEVLFSPCNETVSDFIGAPNVIKVEKSEDLPCPAFPVPNPTQVSCGGEL